MRWGCVREYASDIAFFGGTVATTTVALLGSSESIIGAPKVSDANHEPFYYTMKFFNEMLSNRRFKEARAYSSSEQYSERNPPCYSYAESVNIAMAALDGSEATLEFLALVMRNEERLIIATPLYVALSS